MALLIVRHAYRNLNHSGHTDVPPPLPPVQLFEQYTKHCQRGVTAEARQTQTTIKHLNLRLRAPWPSMCVCAGVISVVLGSEGPRFPRSALALLLRDECRSCHYN